MRLKELRLKGSLTQKELAKKIDMPYTTYNNYENGSRTPDIETLKKLAHYYGVSLDYLCEHNNPDDLGLGFINDKQKDIIKLIPKLNQEDLNKVSGFIAALLTNK